MTLIYMDINCFQGQKSSRVYFRGQRMIEDTKLINDSELRVSGIDALNQALGPSNALRFLSLICQDSTDYVEISRRLYEGQTVEDIFKRAAKNWKS